MAFAASLSNDYAYIAYSISLSALLVTISTCTLLAISSSLSTNCTSLCELRGIFIFTPTHGKLAQPSLRSLLSTLNLCNTPTKYTLLVQACLARGGVFSQGTPESVSHSQLLCVSTCLHLAMPRVNWTKLTNQRTSVFSFSGSSLTKVPPCKGSGELIAIPPSALLPC